MAAPGGRRLRELLAGRARKRKSAFGSGAELREAALRLLDGHLNLRDLLLEVEDSVKPAEDSGIERQKVPSESFIASVLQEQAARLSVPTAILAAKSAVANIEQICEVSTSSSQALLLNTEQRERLSHLLLTVKDLLANNVFCRSLFCQEIWKMKFTCPKTPKSLALQDMKVPLADLVSRLECFSTEAALEGDCYSTIFPLSAMSKDQVLLTQVIIGDKVFHAGAAGTCFSKKPPLLEVVWQLHRDNIVGLEELLESNTEVPAVVEWLCSGLYGLCEQLEEPSWDAELAGRLLTDFVIMFLQNGFQQTSELGRKLEFKKVSHICHAVLQRMLTWVLDAVGKEKQEDVSKLQAMQCWLNVFNVTVYKNAVHPDSLQQFFRHTLTEVLTYRPLLKVSDAIHMQREWTFTRTCSLLTTLYRKLFVAFSAKESICQLQQVLETHEVNWQHVLSCVSTLVVCQAEAEQLFKDLLSCLLIKAFENYDMESMITAFLIARQAALEGPAVFMPYSEWFKASFGNAGGPHGSSKKALVFLFEFLSELVPFETAPYLKVHIMYPPFVPAKHRSVLMEYISLAKTRLADLKVAIEDMGLYEDLSSANESVQPQGQALRDVEKAIQIFENTRKIPTSVIEASIFRRPYYTSWFLPALLRPRVLPKTPDVRMVFIDSLKRADKIPANLYSTYLQACGAMKEKLLQDQSKAETNHSEEPVEQLKAELAELRLLIVDQTKYEDVPAQIAVISDRLSNVLSCSNDENEAATLNSQIHVSIFAPDLEPCYQSVVDLLLTSFCQNLIAASYFNPPDRQGSCLSLFVKMICGHRNLLPALLGRLCQLIYHQGPSLSNAHILGLAAFVIHLSEHRSLIPEVEVDLGTSQPVPEKILSITEYWNFLLVCRTEESFAFCLRFCTAAVSYLLCKFSSLPHDDLFALFPPSLIKKLQYTVPRLNLEARGIAYEEGKTELVWNSLSCPSVHYKRASLCLWKQARFQELLKEKAFQLSFREWLLLELGVHRDKDILSASERHDFHYWAIYQQYLPAPPASGGCDGDLEKACGIIISAILDFSQGVDLDGLGYDQLKMSINPDILCKLQEMVLELRCRRKLLSGCLDARRHFLFRVFQERLKGREHGSALGEQLWRQQELLLQRRILVGLPASALILTHQKGKKTILDCEDFFHFVNSELKNTCSRGYVLSYDITAHFFRGLLNASLDCEESAEGVNDVLTTCQTKCPIVLFSAALWWPRLELVLCSQWQRLFGAPLAAELATLRERWRSAASFLSSEAIFPVSGPPWISAAFLHFAVQQQSAHGRVRDALKRLGTETEQLLVSLLFFSLMDLISAKIAPKSQDTLLLGCEGRESATESRMGWAQDLEQLCAQEGVDFQKSLEWSLEVLQCLEERGVSWPLLFHPIEKVPRKYRILRSAASEHHLRLLPVAFYSLTAGFGQELFTREPAFLCVALDLYMQLLQLFLEGEDLPQADKAGQGPGLAEHVDSLEVITKARQFLLGAIPRCPPRSFGMVQPLLDTYEKIDPELQGALLHWSRAAAALELDEELVLF